MPVLILLLPIYPFLYILAAGAIVRIVFHKKVLTKIYYICIGLILLIYILMCFMIWPHYLSYFSEAVGGSQNGYKYIMDSNLDWGQDLKNLKLYVDENNITEIYTMVSGWSGPEYYDIPAKQLPDNETFIELDEFSGYAAISMSYLNLEKPKYSWLFNYKPIDQVGHSIYIYKIE